MAKHSVDFSHITAGALALALAPAFWPSDAAAHTCDAPFTTDLVTGTGIDVGQVKVCNDAEFLTVTYEPITLRTRFISLDTFASACAAP